MHAALPILSSDLPLDSTKDEAVENNVTAYLHDSTSYYDLYTEA